VWELKRIPPQVINVGLLHTIKERLENSLEKILWNCEKQIADLVREIEEALDEIPREVSAGSKGGMKNELKEVMTQVQKIGKEIDALQEKEKNLEKTRKHFTGHLKMRCRACKVQAIRSKNGIMNIESGSCARAVCVAPR